jgi:hypothetical protein
LFDFVVLVTVLTDIYHRSWSVVVFSAVWVPPRETWQTCPLFGCGIPEKTGLLQQKDVSLLHCVVRDRHYNYLRLQFSCWIRSLVTIAAGIPQHPRGLASPGPSSPLVSKTSSYRTKSRAKASPGLWCFPRERRLKQA